MYTIAFFAEGVYFLSAVISPLDDGYFSNFFKRRLYKYLSLCINIYTLLVL